MNILLFEPSEQAHDSSLFLAPSDARARHIRGVLNAERGQSLRAGIVDGVAGTAVLVSDSSEGLRLMFYPDTEGETESTAPVPHERARRNRESVVGDIHVILGSVRPIQLKRLLRDLTAFAVRTVTVATAELSESSYFHASMWEQPRLRQLLVEGAMQGGHTCLPVVRRVNSILEALNLTAADMPEGGPDVLKVYLDDMGRTASALRGNHRGNASVIAIGPERGFTEAEKRTLEKCAFEPVGIPGGILRAETAAVAGVAVLRSCTPSE